MDKRVIIPGLVIIALSVVWFGAGSPWTGEEEEAWVAMVGDSPLHLSDYKVAYQDYILSTGLPDTARRRTDFLERLITMRLLALDAREIGLDASGEFEYNRQRMREKLLIEGYVATQVLAPIEVTEDELREMFIRVNTRLNASHLYAETLEEALSLKARLDGGESFDDLAREVFADEQLRNSGGNIGEFGFDEMDWAFEDAAFSMEPGQISGPVETAQGFSIIRLEDRFTQPVLTESGFAERKGGLARYVLVRKHQAARDALREEIIAELSPVFNPEVLEALLADLTGGHALDAETSLVPDDVLVTYSGGRMDVREFLQASARTSETQRAAVTDGRSLQDYTRGLLIRQELLSRAGNAEVENSTAYAIAHRREESNLLYEAGWNHIENQIVVPDDSIAAHIERFPDEFEIPAQVRVREILVSDARTASDLARLVTAGNFEEFAAQHSIRGGAAQNGGDLGFVTREQLGQVATPVFEAKEGSIVGPLAVGGRFALFQILETASRRPASVEESRVRVEDQLRAAWVRKAVRDRADELRSRTTIERRLDLLDDLRLRSTETPSVATMNP